MEQFGDALSAMDVSAINRLIKQDTFNGSDFFVLFEKVLASALGFMFRALV